MQPLVIITDMTAHGDDLIAIALLASSATVSIQSIIATSGNVWAEEAAANVRHLLRKLRRTDISVTVGQSAADFCARRPAYHKNLAELTAVYRGAFERQPPDGAVPARIDLADAFTHDGARPDVLLIGPATVFAEALQRDPDLPNQIGQVFVMGGAIDRIGNATPKAEFNFWFDPEAAETLLSSTVPITLLPLDTVRGLFSSFFVRRLPASKVAWRGPPSRMPVLAHASAGLRRSTGRDRHQSTPRHAPPPAEITHRNGRPDPLMVQSQSSRTTPRDARSR